MGPVHYKTPKKVELILFLFAVLFLLTFNQAHAYPAPEFKEVILCSSEDADGLVHTLFYALIAGPSPEDVTSFTATGPSGTFVLTSGSSLKEQGLYYVYEYSEGTGIIEDGAYTFQVTDSIGRSVSVVRNFSYDATLPQVNPESISPSNYSYVGTTTPTLSFDPVAGNVYYNVIIRDYDEKAIWWLSSRSTSTSFAVPSGILQPNTAYKWRARVWDSATDPQNRQESTSFDFYTGTQDVPELTSNGVMSLPVGDSFQYLLNYAWANCNNVAPWDIESFLVNGPDETVFDLANARAWMFYSQNGNNGQLYLDPPTVSVPDGTYTIEIMDNLENTVTTSSSYVYNPVPDFSADTRVPADNAYFDTDTPSFSWSRVTGDDGNGSYRYTIRIVDYANRIRWYDSPSSEDTTFTLPESLDLPKGSSYKWTVNVYGPAGSGGTDSNNYRGSTSRTFTINEPISLGTYYVDIVDGNDSNNGSQAHPWETFHYAISRINAGAAGTYILIMAAGTYSKGNGEADSKLAITQDNVTLIGETGSMPVIDGTDCETWKTGIIIEGDNVKIRNLDVRSFSETGIYVSSDCSGHEINGCDVHENTTGIADNSNGCTIKGCKVYSNNGDGIKSNQTTNGMITGNTVYGNGLGGGFRNGIFIAECSPEVSRNKVYDNYRNISIEGWDAATTSPTVKNNLIYEVSETVEKGIYVYANHASAVVSPYIYHNTIDLCKDGIAIALGENGGTSAPQIKYNIVTNSNEVGIRNNSGSPIISYNDVWNRNSSADNYIGCTAGTGGISSDPKYGSYTLQSDSPCIDAIPTGADPGDPVTMDYPGYARPQGSGFDMGAYEYIATKTYPDTLPGGTGVETDYRIFTVPLNIGTGQDMRNTMEGTLGSYAQTHWRVFARTTSGDVEMNTQAFTSLDIKPGMGFWLITVYTNTINFQGTLAPDAIYYEIELAPGWHLFAVPWPDTSIELGRIYVTDGVNQYTITDASNTLTQKYIWDYTGTGPSSGYVERSASDFSLVAGTGYFIKILGSSNITLSIPPNNSSNSPNNDSVSTLHTVSSESLESVRLPDDSEPPPLPSGSYGPMPDIRANGKSGPLTVSRGTSVSVKVSLDPGNRPLKKADWWVVAHTPFLPPNNWYSYVYPKGWQPGIHVCVQTLPFLLPPSFEVLNMALPAGDYTFYFAVDENADGIVDETWKDSVEVRVE